MKSIMYFDGGCYPNPGQMDMGLVFKGDHEDTYFQMLSQGTNNLAEWYALLTGLQISISVGITDIKVIGDSEIIINQILGKYKVKNKKFIPLHAECIELIKQFESFEIEHILRDGNLAGKLIEETR